MTELKPTLNSILTYIKEEIEKRYKKNESKLRSLKEEEETTNINRNNKQLVLLNNSSYVEINKKELISVLIFLSIYKILIIRERKKKLSEIT